MLTYNMSEARWKMRDEEPCVMADPHFNHEKIIEYCNRPFTDTKDMDEQMITKWNKKVGKKQHAYILGDFGFGDSSYLASILQRLNGQIHIVWGNHEKPTRKFTSLFTTCHDYVELKVNDYPMMCMFHFPQMTWNKAKHGTWHLHGHAHGWYKDDPNFLRIDVGADCTNYEPLTMSEIAERMSKKTFKEELHPC